jgi:hypothetical protein
VGRNVSHHNKQSGFWVKQATDVILSQNEAYGIRPSNSGMGQCFGNQYGTDWIWFIFNYAHDCEYGIAAMSDDARVSHNFFIGNLIRNIHRTTSGTGPSDAWGPSAIMMVGGHERHVINNTIYDVDSGVNSPAPNGSLEIAGNIIANITQSAGGHIMLALESLANNTLTHHNLFFGNPRMSWGSKRIFPTAAQLAANFSLSSDPQFINPAAGDLHIAVTSPAKNAADFNTVYTTFRLRYGVSIAFDKDGSTRTEGAATDMGTYLAAGVRDLPPTISAISAQTTNEDTPLGPIAFSVSDVETPAANLTVSGVSSNTTLIPNGNITFSGSGANRTVRVVPAANQSGMALVAVVVSDGVTSTSNLFLVTVVAVNDPPVISSIANQMTIANTVKGPIGFSVTDVETTATSLSVSASSSNTVLVPNANVTFSGSGANRTLTIVPAPNRTGTTTITVTVGDGNLTSSTSFNFAVPARGDFDSDGRGDVILRHKSTGENIAWLMNGVSVSGAALLSTIADTNWVITGVGDFNADGKADVIWRNRTTGQNIAWLMNGLAVANSAFLSTIADTNWEIKGVGDLNGDGKADVLWRNKATGQNIGWLMNGLSVAGSALLSTIADTNWDIKGVGDFNADGKADVLWRNKATGQNLTWLMNGLTVSTSAFLSTIADTNWEIKGVGDFNADGKADVIWRHAVTGQNIGWLMNGLTVANSAFLSTIADTNWDIRTVSDAGGDGKADVEWRNKVTGQNIGWVMNGLTVASSGFLPTVADTNWEIVGP